MPPNNVIITIQNEEGYPNTVNIKYSENAQVIDNENQLMEMLANDDSIDINPNMNLGLESPFEI